MAAVLNVIADDVEWQISGPPDKLPYAGKRHGREQVAQFFAWIAENATFEHFEPQQFIAQEDEVVALVYERVRSKSTGRILEQNFTQVFTLCEGKIIRFRYYFDTAAAVAAFRGV